jgi:site-specific recombinase XerD
MLGELPRFCQFIIGLGLGSLPELEPPHITAFILSLNALSPRTVGGYSTLVRCFLRFLYLRQIIQADLTGCVPSCYLTNYGKIPSVWTQEEVVKLLAQVDRGSPRGKRDYAILMLGARTGMRVGDIIRLKLNNINWEQKRIEIIQNKTKTSLTIPLSEDLGWALIDYMKNARPKTKCDVVFLSLHSPSSPFVAKDNLYHIIAKYRRMAGIHRYARQSGGMHTLRHSLASNLLSLDTPLPTISNILGHSDPASTAYYIKVDIAHLRECAIDADEVSNER